MSALETRTQQFLQPLLMGERCNVDYAGQVIIAEWSTKTAMVLEGLDQQDCRTFTQAEREQLRSLAAIPWRTSVWLAASADPSLFMSTKNRHLGADAEQPSGVSITMAFAHVVIQVLRIRAPENVGPNTLVTTNVRRGPWAQTTVQIWPARLAPYGWPPPMALNGESGLNVFAERFNTATEKQDSIETLAV
jgi:hypothetical protein